MGKRGPPWRHKTPRPRLDLTPPHAPSINKRLKKLEKEAEGYADTDQADLAEGLKDDIKDTRARVDKARQGSRARIMKKLAIGLAAAGWTPPSLPFAEHPHLPCLTSTVLPPQKPPPKEFVPPCFR